MTLLELYNEKYGKKDGSQDHFFVAAVVNKSLKELTAEVNPDDEVEFIGLDSPIGVDLYKRSIILLMLKAAKDVLGKMEGDYRIEVMYSLGSGFFCRLQDTTTEVTDELLAQIKARMDELVEEDLPIEKMVCSTRDMREEFRARDLPAKADLLKFRQSSKINIEIIFMVIWFHQQVILRNTTW